MSEQKRINIDDTRFIYETNFSGDPKRDSYGDNRRKANIVIPDAEQAKDLMKQGFKVRSTKPRKDDDPDEFEPTYYINGVLKYRTKENEPVKYPPNVFLVSGDNEPVKLSEDTVGQLDQIRVKNVNVVLNPYEWDPVNHKLSLYIRTLYVEQDLEDDPYAERYRRARMAVGKDEEEPF